MNSIIKINKPDTNRLNLFKILLVGIVFIIFCQPSSLYFLNDDFDSLPNYAKTNFFNNGGMRLTEEASLMLDTWLYNTKALGYILTSLFIHILVCATAFVWLKKVSDSFGILFRTQTKLGIALLFMWYAFHTEPIIWPDCRTASLAVLFFLLAYNCLLKGILKNNYLIWLSLPIFVLGIFSYEYCWLYPLSITIWWFLLDKNSSYKTKNAGISIASSWVLLAAYFPVRKYLVTEWIGGYLSSSIVKPHNYSVYIKNCFALFGRSFLPPMENKIALSLATATIILLLAGFSYKLWKEQKLTKFWWFLLVNWLLSYVFFITLGIDTNGYESERYLYAPSFFLCAWLIYTFTLLPIKKTFYYPLFVLFLAYHVFFLYKSLQAYKKTGDICKETIAAIKKNLGAKYIFIENLPTKSFGIPTFGLGLNKTIKWFYPSSDTAKIKTLSTAKFGWKEHVVVNDSIDLNTGNAIIYFTSDKINSSLK